ncbi:MAG: 3-oxoacyl-ACP reductase FabG [Alphaproteobacteria bacterium]
MLDFTDKNILITGASGGIGKAICQKFALLNANLIVSGTSSAKLDSLKNELNYNKIVAIPANLENTAEIENLVKQANDAFGGLDAVICNAGITKDNLALRMSEEDFLKVLNINLVSAFSLAKNSIKIMMKKRAGKIIFISSVVASLGNAGQANYVASKAGLEGMCRSLALEVASRGININSIAPGFIETEMTQKLPPEIKQKMMDRIPLGYFANPSVVADSCLFLASNLASYITGQTIHVNGGMVMK